MTGRAFGATGGVLAAALLAGPLGACRAPRAAPSGRLSVVVAENTWGSLASQLGGRQVAVTSILTDPNADPHEYETSAADARAFAGARLVIANGDGYDSWAFKLLSVSPGRARRLLDVARLLHKRPGSNPHFWYDPGYVRRVITAITSRYVSLRPSARRYFEKRRQLLLERLRPYSAELAEIRTRFAGRRVAATESIFVYLARYLRLDLVSPRAFMLAMSEGTDPPAQSVARFADQIRRRAFSVLVYNRQTVNPLTEELRSQAVANGIPVVAVSEVIDPPSMSFEAWMSGQLARLRRALSRGARP